MGRTSARIKQLEQENHFSLSCFLKQKEINEKLISRLLNLEQENSSLLDIIQALDSRLEEKFSIESKIIQRQRDRLIDRVLVLEANPAVRFFSWIFGWLPKKKVTADG